VRGRPAADQPALARSFTSDARIIYAKHGRQSRAGTIVDALLGESAEFAELWAAHEVNSASSMNKRIQHPEVGMLELQCQVLHDLVQGQSLLVFTATPGTESYDKLQLLSVIGSQRLASGN
jgi:hypothetical protein